MNHRGVAEQIVWVTAGRLLSRGSLVAASIILARTLEVQAFASFSYFLLTISMLALYASMGMGVTANRYFVGADNPDARQSRTIAAIVTISVGFSIVLTCAVMFVPEKWLVGELSIPRWAIIIGILAYSLEVVPQNAMNGLEKYRQDAFLSVLSGGFVIVMVIYASRMQNLELAMVALIGGSIIRVVGGVLVVIRAIGWRQFTGGFPFTMSDVVRTLKFSLPLFLVSLLYSAGPWLVGRIILSGDDGEHALALYAIGLQWFSLGMFLPASVSRISVPRLARSIDNPRAEDPVRNHVIFGMKLSHKSMICIGRLLKKK
jgi:O-antigen/teichoic acid export membrane protein